MYHKPEQEIVSPSFLFGDPEIESEERRFVPRGLPNYRAGRFDEAIAGREGTDLKALRLALARALFEAGLWILGSLSEGGMLFLKGGEIIFFRDNGRVPQGDAGRIEAAAGRRAKLSPT
jgi:hypothetical protein